MRGRSKFYNHATPNALSNLNNHYSDLSDEVSNVSLSQGGQKYLSKTFEVFYTGQILSHVSIKHHENGEGPI